MFLSDTTIGGWEGTLAAAVELVASVVPKVAVMATFKVSAVVVAVAVLSLTADDTLLLLVVALDGVIGSREAGTPGGL